MYNSEYLCFKLREVAKSFITWWYYLVSSTIEL